jgi:hypothetical protein
MNSTIIPDTRFLMRRSVVALLIVVIACGAAALGEDPAQSKNSAVDIRATHLLGFEGARNNANGTLSIQGDALQFQKSGKPAIQVKIASLQDIFLGEQGKQVGGTPMTLGKAAVPFGGGRAVSLFAHKKYDTLVLEYVDSNGGVHGAIFQLNKGQAVTLRNELVAKGAHVSEGASEALKQSNAEVSSESK